MCEECIDHFYLNDANLRSACINAKDTINGCIQYEIGGTCKNC